MTHKPSEMSGGQQQRVAIARAIAQAPPVILADEPTGNLDSHSSQEIMNILKQLHAEGRTVIVITHDNDIAANAKRIVHIEDGRITSDSANEGLSRDDIAKEIRGNSTMYGEEDSMQLPSEDDIRKENEEAYISQTDDYDLDVKDETIDLHLIGDKQNEQEE